VIDAEGWFNTGDLARFDGEILSIVGRTKELIIRSGFEPAAIDAHRAIMVLRARRGGTGSK
jgi:long-subunit acyl-CoA synthetase (AMP-forming)